jgi:hypothetical protein
MPQRSVEAGSRPGFTGPIPFRRRHQLMIVPIRDNRMEASFVKMFAMDTSGSHDQ